MSGGNTYQTAYRKNQIQTATPQQLVLMLYERAIRDLRQTTEAIEAADLLNANKLLLHVEDILNELLISLDLDLPVDEGGQIALDLGRLYDHYIVRCREANITKDPAIVAELQQHLSDLRDTWVEAMRKALQESKGTSREV
ncbi:MAG: flagellar export chaperone FliS [Symbiobacteriaceae bacterium]|nr:flagellar export chaperone FliS [Symbiobacteriaceae bacterium]